MPDDRTLGALLRRLRGERSAEATAAACAVPPAVYRDWEQDRRKPDLVSAYLLAQWLGVPLDQLAECLMRQVRQGPKADLTTAPPPRRTGRKLPGKPPHGRQPRK